MKATRHIVFSLLILTTLLAANAQKTPDNIVIERHSQLYRIIPDKSGEKPAKIKLSEQNTFRARRTAGKALSYTTYNDDVKLDKASGGKTTYGSAIPEWVFYDDSKGCLVEVELKGKDSRGKATFERTFNDPTLLDRIVVGDNYEIENAEISFELPTAMRQQFSFTTGNVDPSKVTQNETVKGAVTTVTFGFRDIAPAKREPLAPPIAFTAPTIYVKGIFENLDSLYGYLHSFIPETDPGTDEIKRTAAEITAGCNTDSARIDAVTDYVHKNIRYLAVENGRLGNAPDLASEVLRKRFGDCKGSAILIRDLLRACGIDSRLVWIGTERVPTEWTDFPTRSSGNHMIACVMTGDSILYIDGTATYIPAGQLPTGIQGRQTLIEGSNAGEYTVGRVPTLSPSSNRCVIKYSYDIDPSGKESTGRYTELLTGRYNSWIHNLIESRPPKERDNAIMKYIAGNVPSCHASAPEYSLGKYESSVSADLRSTAVAQRVGDDIYLSLNPWPTFKDKHIDMRERRTGLRLDHRQQQEISVEATLPEGYEVESIPESGRTTTDWIDATVSSVADGKQLRTTLVYTVKALDIPLDRMKEYNDAIEAINRQLTNRWILSPTESGEK